MCDNNKDVSLLNKKPNSKINKLLKEQDTFIPELRKSNEELKKVSQLYILYIYLKYY